MIKRLLITAILLLAGGMAVHIHAQDVALKTNGLFWLTTTTNASVEFATSDKFTLELAGAYNPWTFSDDRKMRFWLAQPEMKYWICEKFEGHFVGLHLHGAQFFGGWHEKRYDGYLAGGGFSYGYDWILSPHWNLEAEIGIGYAHLWYDESPRIPCEKCKRPRHKNYVGPTKAAISIVYIF